MFFESIGLQGEQLEPKWHSHFGNYIVNTLLALHKFQAKKQVFPNRIENDRNGTKQLHRSVSTFCYAVGFAAVFLSDANRINHKWFHRKLGTAVVVSHVKTRPTRRSVKLAQVRKGKRGL